MPGSGGAVGAWAFFTGAAGSGGTRSAWPGTSLVDVSARLPSTRIWPVRQSFCTAPWVIQGKWRRNQRSRRMSASSAVTNSWMGRE